MKHTFNLNHPKAETSPIRLIVSHNGTVYRKSTGLAIRTKLWDGKASSWASVCKDKKIWDKLKPIHLRLEEVEDDVMTEKEAQDAISYALTGQKSSIPERPSFWPYFKQWSDRAMTSRRFRQLAYRRISAVMGTAGDWEDITKDWFFRFTQKMKAAGYSTNYHATLTNKLRCVCKEGFDRGFTKNEDFRQFGRKWETADSVALTMEEVDALWDLELRSQEERKARDLFILGVYTAARFQNYSKLAEDNIVDGRIRFIQPKTGDSVVIPCAPRVREVLARWGGRAPELSNVNMNLKIKEVCRKAGMTEIVEVRRTEGGRLNIRKCEKWELVGAHTARRTGATILHLMGVPSRQLMMITGHKTERDFNRYLRIGKEQNADLLADNPFFR